jgi:hypothetical protein
MRSALPIEPLLAEVGLRPLRWVVAERRLAFISAVWGRERSCPTRQLLAELVQAGAWLDGEPLKQAWRQGRGGIAVGSQRWEGINLLAWEGRDWAPHGRDDAWVACIREGAETVLGCALEAVPPPPPLEERERPGAAHFAFRLRRLLQDPEFLGGGKAAAQVVRSWARLVGRETWQREACARGGERPWVRSVVRPPYYTSLRLRPCTGERLALFRAARPRWLGAYAVGGDGPQGGVCMLCLAAGRGLFRDDQAHVLRGCLAGFGLERGIVREPLAGVEPRSFVVERRGNPLCRQEAEALVGLVRTAEAVKRAWSHLAQLPAVPDVATVQAVMASEGHRQGLWWGATGGPAGLLRWLQQRGRARATAMAAVSGWARARAAFTA